MNAAQSRLGLYTDFKTLTPIADYAYPYEQSYDMKLPYGGYVNRSRGCYTMDVTGYLQGVWSSFVEARRTLPDGDTPREITGKEWGDDRGADRTPQHLPRPGGLRALHRRLQRAAGRTGRRQQRLGPLRPDLQHDPLNEHEPRLRKPAPAGFRIYDKAIKHDAGEFSHRRVPGESENHREVPR